MRKIIVYLSLILAFSCSLNDDAQDYHFEILPVESVIIPNEFVLGEVYEITLTYIRPSNCHAFNDIYYARELNERTVAIIAIVFTNNGNCEEIEDELEATLSFKPTNNGSYVFKFWQGEDGNGEDQYLIVEVPVID